MELSLNPEKELKEFVRNRLGGRCAYCGTIPPPGQMTVDHITPITWYKKQGRLDEADDPRNLAPACRSCNKWKDDSDVWEWWMRSNLLTDERCKDLIEIMLHESDLQSHDHR